MRSIGGVVLFSLLVPVLVHCSGDLPGGNSGDAGNTAGATGGEAAGGAATGGSATAGDTVGGSSTGGAAAGGEATGGASTGGTESADAAIGSSDLPCEVQHLLATRCQGCHTKSPPGAMLNHADLMAQGRVDPSKTMAELALERMQATGALHMPPAPLETPTADEISEYSAWLSSGALAGDCTAPSDPGMDPYDTPVVCTSTTYWTGGNRESPLMRPGGACVSCHQAEHEGPLFAIAGTLFPSPHEPDDCNGVNGGDAEVIITDANGAEHRLTPNAAGNFFLEGALATPYSARVSYGGKERAMLKTQTKGDCNSCHTEAGTEDAPGRIFLP